MVTRHIIEDEEMDVEANLSYFTDLEGESQEEREAWEKAQADEFPILHPF